MPIEEKIRTYIGNTTFPSDALERYDIGIKELNCLRQLTLKNWFEGLRLAYRFGMAKGFRLARRKKK